ncbi:MAG: hypothetical protein HC890_06380 [Chloroflexaceae bacterium]|nr:hypothetical protein [Chloroflexaceae bacterium]
MTRIVLLGCSGSLAVGAFWLSQPEQQAAPTQDDLVREMIAASRSAPAREVVVRALPTLPPAPAPQPQSSPPEASPAQPSSPATPQPNLQASLELYLPLFATPTALGMLAIGTAEGNYRVWAEEKTLFVQPTVHYFGHTDPGNLSWGERVTNYGSCSDQGRSGGDIKQAEQYCSERAQAALPAQLRELGGAGIDPSQELEAVLNIADLYNQAQPIHSQRFPQALATARRGGVEWSGGDRLGEDGCFLLG